MLVATVALAASCVSPTLPLPPPSEPETISQSSVDPDVWTLSGTCQPGAQVNVFNERTQRGVFFVDFEQTGRYSLEIEASECDFGWLTQTYEGDSSERVGFVFEAVSQGTPVDSSKCK
jgi:hypothetical protein